MTFSIPFQPKQIEGIPLLFLLDSASSDFVPVVAELAVDVERAGLEVDLPAVISTDLRLNQPRFVKLPDIMKAKKKPLETISLGELGIDAAPFFDIQGYEAPPERAKGAMVEDVAGLIGALKEKGFFA